MKKTLTLLLLSILISMTSCIDSNKQVEDDIKMYTYTWDEIINNRKLDLFNSANFDENIVLKMNPENVVGIENVKDFYNNYLTGFSNIEFSIIDVFGQGNKIVKHWNFKGTHTGDFFGIPPTGKFVNINGSTLVKMKDGRIAEEEDFMDNMAFMQQLGLVSSPNNINIIKKCRPLLTKTISVIWPP